MFGDSRQMGNIRNMYSNIEIEKWQDNVPDFYDYISKY